MLLPLDSSKTTSLLILVDSIVRFPPTSSISSVVLLEWVSLYIGVKLLVSEYVIKISTAPIPSILDSTTTNL